MPSDGITKATWVLAAVTFILVLVTGYYAWQTYRLVEHESVRWSSETRPYLEVRFLDWGEGERRPQFEIVNVGHWAAVQVQLEQVFRSWSMGEDIVWENTSASLQGSMTVSPGGNIPVRFYFSEMWPKVDYGPKPPLTQVNWSREFYLRYHDVGGYREFIDKWKFQVYQEKPLLEKINATELKRTPPSPEKEEVIY